MMKYIGLTRYEQEDVENLLNLKPDGVVLGDLFCNRKMFPYGGVELVEIIQLFKRHGISAIYQTPMYATDRIFSDVLQKVVYLFDNELIDAVIVQDIGMASAISDRCKGLTVIWGKMGYARTPVVNSHTLSFYMKHGVSGFECKDREQAEFASKIGASVFMVYGYPKYLTVNRECYYRFERNVFGDDCGLGCLKHERMVIPAAEQIETSIDGYTLGWKYVYDENRIGSETAENYIVYADSFSEAQFRLNEISAHN